jgi:hypothetical protein
MDGSWVRRNRASKSEGKPLLEPDFPQSIRSRLALCHRVCDGTMLILGRDLWPEHKAVHSALESDRACVIAL